MLARSGYLHISTHPFSPTYCQFESFILGSRIIIPGSNKTSHYITHFVTGIKDIWIYENFEKGHNSRTLSPDLTTTTSCTFTR